jgi:hypothetical protein
MISRTILNQVKWWSDELEKNQYDGIIGLSQGAAMTALLVSMVCTALPFLKFDSLFVFRNVADKTPDVFFMCSLITQKGSPVFTQRLSPSSLPYSAQVCLIKQAYTTLLSWYAGFISSHEPHGNIYGVPENVPTLHS